MCPNYKTVKSHAVDTVSSLCEVLHANHIQSTAGRVFMNHDILCRTELK